MTASRQSMRTSTMICVFATVCAGCAAEPAAGPGMKSEQGRTKLNIEADGFECTTTIVRGLTEQLIDEANCIEPGVFRRIDALPGVALSTAAQVAPYLHHEAADALERAVGRGRGALSINSAMRSLAQQYLLRAWVGHCGITAAAPPGSSNHETGLAIDVSRGDLSSWRSVLEAEGFDWFGSGDEVHFDYRGGEDLSGLSIRAFQRLWNRNNPDDTIAVDGLYGSDTARALSLAPAEGFAVGARCDVRPTDDGSDGGEGDGDTEPSGELPDDGSEPGGDDPLGCSAGTDCADCNAIHFNCGFCPASGRCMAGDGGGPFEGSCGGEWLWVPPSTCPASDPEPEPWCSEVRGSCTGSAECCDGLSCREGVTYDARCCVEAGGSCSGGGDCCGYMDCDDGTCTCRGAGRACLADADCCSGDCEGSYCR